jgi:beta-mannosidase
VSIDLFSNGETLADQAKSLVEVAPRGSTAINVNELFPGFYDLNYAYQFGPPKYDVVAGRLDVDGETRSEDTFLPLGQGRAREVDVGLTATWVGAEDTYTLSVATRRFAQWVSIAAPGFRPSDSWFHLSPNSKRSITLQGTGGSRPPRGRVRAINSVTDAVIRPAEAQ